MSNIVHKLKSYRDAGTLSKKLRNFMKQKISVFFVSFPYYLHFAFLPSETRVVCENWKFYTVLKNRYKKILRSLPVFSEPKAKTPRIIWWCWLQGEENAPKLCRACLASLRKNLPDFEVRVITAQNMWNYITVPDFIKRKYEKGKISHTHFSDILRTCLLCEHGGSWIDSTVFCTGYHSKILTKQLFYFSNLKRRDCSIEFSNWMISACKNHPVLLALRTLLFDYWKKHNRLYHYFFYHFFATMILEKYSEVKKSVSVFSNVPSHIMQDELFEPYSEERWNELSLMSDFHKLTYKFSPYQTACGTVYEHILQGAEK